MRIGRPKLEPYEVYYDSDGIPNLKYTKVLYMDSDNKLQEITSESTFFKKKYISVCVDNDENINIHCPTEIIIKFATDDALYLAKTILKEIKKTNAYIYLYIDAPIKLIKQQKRKYGRVDLKRTCVLVVSDNKGKDTAYLAKSVNLSASGILLTDMETMLNNDYYNQDLSKLDCFHIILCLEKDITFKLFARFVRHDSRNGSHYYAFHFLNMKDSDISTISQYVTAEQVKKMKLNKVGTVSN